MTTLLTSPSSQAAPPAPALSLHELAAIARGLAETAHIWPDVTDPKERIWHTIARTDRFEAFVIAWPAGSSIELHDHGEAAGAIAVAAGELIETAVHDVAGWPTFLPTRLTAGIQLSFREGHVHGLHNPGLVPALTVHVYSPVLRSMTFFDHDDEGARLAVRTELFDPEEVA